MFSVAGPLPVPLTQTVLLQDCCGAGSMLGLEFIAIYLCVTNVPSHAVAYGDLLKEDNVWLLFSIWATFKALS